MPESESGGPKKPGKSASSAAKPAAKTAARSAAKKPTKAAAKATSKKPAKAAANPAARKPAKAAGTAAKTASSATKKPAKVVSATPRKAAAARKPAGAKKPAAAAGTSAKGASAASPPRKARSAAPKVTPAVAEPKPLSVVAEKPAPAVPPPPAASAPPAAQAPAPRAPAKRTVVEGTARAYFDALAARDADAAMRVWSPDGIDDVLPLGIFRGREAISAFLKELFAAVPDMRFTVERITADDKVAAVQWRSVGTFSAGTFQGLEPTGRRVELRGVDCLEVVDGKIVHNTGVFDGAAFARQVGLLPSEDSGADRAIRAGFNTVTKLRRTVAKRTAR